MNDLKVAAIRKQLWGRHPATIYQVIAEFLAGKCECEESLSSKAEYCERHQLAEKLKIKL